MIQKSLNPDSGVQHHQGTLRISLSCLEEDSYRYHQCISKALSIIITRPIAFEQTGLPNKTSDDH